MTTTKDHLSIVPGSLVSLHIALRFENGDLALSTFDEDPMQFTLGDGSLSPGIEMALFGMKAGDCEKLELMPDQAFGARDESQLHCLPRTDFPADMMLEPGVVIQFDTPSGVETAGTVRKVAENEVEVDFNHPLAGVTLHLETQILQVELPRDEETL